MRIITLIAVAITPLMAEDLDFETFYYKPPRSINVRVVDYESPVKFSLPSLPPDDGISDLQRAFYISHSSTEVGYDLWRTRVADELISLILNSRNIDEAQLKIQIDSIKSDRKLDLYLLYEVHVLSEDEHFVFLIEAYEDPENPSQLSKNTTASLFVKTEEGFKQTESLEKDWLNKIPYSNLESLELLSDGRALIADPVDSTTKQIRVEELRVLERVELMEAQ